MDFLNLSSCFLYPHLLFCFPCATFTNFSCYSSPLSPPLTFSHPIPLPYTPSPSALAPSAFLLSYRCPMRAGIPPQVHPPHMRSLCTSIPLCVGHSMGTPCPWGWWGAMGWTPVRPASWVKHHSFARMATRI